MPTYKFYHEPSDTQWDEMMSMAEREQYLKDNPEVRQVPVAVALTGDHIMGIGPKVDGGFTENMQRIASAHPNSPLADRYGSGKTNAEIKARETIKRYK